MVNLRKNGVILRSEAPIALVGGGEIGPDDVNLVLKRVDKAVAADGGAGALIDSGHMPDAVIGDFDSVSERYLQQVPKERLFPISEQNTTDFDKALRSVQTPLALGVGFLGARVDHQLATFNTMVRLQDKPCILLGAHEVVFHAPPSLELPLRQGAVVSLFPFRRVTGRSAGLEWPIKDLVLEPGGMVGTSNRATSKVSLNIDSPGLLVMVPREALDMVIYAFCAAQAPRWPSPVL